MASLLLFISFDRTHAVNFNQNFSVIEDDVNSRLYLYVQDVDFETTISMFEYNIGRGWIPVMPIMGSVFGNSDMYAEIDYMNLPKLPYQVKFRIIDGNNSVHNLTSFNYSGDVSGCDYDACPYGSYPPFNVGMNTGIPLFDNTVTESFGAGITASTLSTYFETYNDDVVVAAIVHYRSNTEEVSEIKFINENFTFGCRDRSSEYTTEVWYLAGANFASSDIVVNWTNDVEDAFVTATSFYGADIANPIGVAVCNNDGGVWTDNHNIGISSDTNQMIYGGATTYSGGNNDIVSTSPNMNEVSNLRIGNVSTTSAYKDGESSLTTLAWSTPNAWPWSAAAISINGYQGSDNTQPVISFTDAPGSNETSSFSIGMTVTDDISRITSLSLRMYNDTTSTEVVNAILTPSDLTYDETSEEFTYNFSGLPGGSYTLTLFATNSQGLFSVDSTSPIVISGDSEAPTFSVINLGQDPMSSNTPVWTGTVSDASSNVSSLEYSIYNVSTGMTEITWQSATADDGAFDEPSEAFTINSPALLDGAKLLILRSSDDIGNSSLEFTVDRIIIDAYDSSAPILYVKDVVPSNNPDVNLKISGKVKDNTAEKTSNISAIYYRLDGGSWNSVLPQDGTLNDDIEESFEVQFTNLSLGAHSVEFRAVDVTGNDTNIEGINITRNFTTITQPTNLTPANFQTVIDFNSDSYIDFTDSEGLIWGNGRLRLAEEFNPVGTAINTDPVKYGPKYGFGLGEFNIDRSNTNGYWVAKANGLFAYHSFDNNTEYEFDTATYFGHGGVIAYDIVEAVSSGGEYLVWVAAGDAVLSLNFGTSITDGTGDNFSIWNSLTGNVNIVKVDSRDPNNLGIFTKGNQALYRLDSFVYDDTVNNSQSYTSWTTGGGYVTDDIIAIYLDENNNDIWIADNTNGVSRINDAGTINDTSDDTNIATYSSEAGVFDIGEDAAGNIYLVGNIGLKVITNYNGTPSNVGDDTIVTLATQQDLNIDAGGKAVYLPGTFPVEDQFFISNRAGEIYYVSTNGTYEDKFDDQIIRLPLLDIYPTEVRDFYMTDDNTVIAVMHRSGVWSFDLNRLFVPFGYATTKIDPQVANYLNADFIKLESFTRIDSTNAVVTYKASNSSGTTLLSLDQGETVEFPINDHRVVFRIEMFRGSTPVLTNVTFGYSAYPDEEQELGTFTYNNLPTNVNSGNAFSFTINAYDTLSNPMVADVNATVELRRSIDNALINTFNISNITIENGTITIPNAIANVVGNHYLIVKSGSIEIPSGNILFVGNTNPGNNNSGGNQQNNNNVGQTGSTTEENEADDDLEDISVSGNLPQNNVTIDKFEVTEKVVDGKLVLIIEWKVSNAKTIEISGVGQNLPSQGKFEVPVDADQIIQIVATDKDGNQVYSSYVVKDVQKKIAEYSPRTYMNTVIPLAIIALISGIFVMLEYISVSKFFVPIAFIFAKKKIYSGVVYCETKENVVPFALIHVKTPSEEVLEVRADEYGKYLFETDQPGEHKFRINMKGYLDFSETYDVERAGPFGKDIFLRKILLDDNANLAEKVYSKREAIYNFLNIFTVLTLSVGVLICIGQILSGFNIVVFTLGVVYSISLGIVLWKSRVEKVVN